MHDAIASGVRNCVSRRPSHVKPYRQFKRFLSGDNRSLATDMAQKLAPKIDALARELLGEPKAQNRTTWRFGQRGSLMVLVSDEPAVAG